MLERLKWPGLTLVLGGLGAFLRYWQLTTAFEETQGFHISGSPASLVLAAFLLLAAALFLLMAYQTSALPQEKKRISRWDFVFAAGKNMPYMAAMTLAGLLTLAAAPFLFQEAARLMAIRKATGDGDNGLLQVVLGLCVIPACMAAVVTARGAYRMNGRGKENGALLLPALLSCLWLLEAYRANAANPVIWHYAPLLLAVAFGLLFHLDCAGLAFERGHARRMLWLAAMTVVASAVALASAPGKAMMLLLGGQMLTALAALWVAPANLRHPPAAEQFGLRARQRRETPADDLDDETEETPEDDGPGTREIQEEDKHV